MLPTVVISRHSSAESTNLDSYRGLVDEPLLEEIKTLSRRLSGLRICHVNATAAGGGVAELLFRLVPFYRALGLPTDWRIIHGDVDFFKITKSFHNALQGAPFELTEDIRRGYLAQNESGAAGLDADYDVLIIHDPQPAAIRSFKERSRAKWVWRCHIDSSSPNGAAWSFLRPFIESHDAAVFTLQAFMPTNLAMKRVAFIPPGIDPFSSKNMEIPVDLCRKVVRLVLAPKHHGNDRAFRLTFVDKKAAEISGIAAPTPHQLEIRLPKPFPALIETLADVRFSILSKASQKAAIGLGLSL